MQYPTLDHERTLLSSHPFVVGIDEVGRGCVAGPVVCGAVAISTLNPAPPGLADSKLLSPARRQALVNPVRQWVHSWALGWAGPDIVDDHGIMAALHRAATAALAALALPTAAVILDGNRDYLSPTDPSISVTTLIKGDQLCASVAAASILAKTARDAYMTEQAAHYPDYAFDRHVGYLTAAHRSALAAHGPTPLHRLSFAGVLPVA